MVTPTPCEGYAFAGCFCSGDHRERFSWRCAQLACERALDHPAASASRGHTHKCLPDSCPRHRIGHESGANPAGLNRLAAVPATQHLVQLDLILQLSGLALQQVVAGRKEALLGAEHGENIRGALAVLPFGQAEGALGPLPPALLAEVLGRP